MKNEEKKILSIYLSILSLKLFESDIRYLDKRHMPDIGNLISVYRKILFQEPVWPGKSASPVKEETAEEQRCGRPDHVARRCE